MKGLGKRTSILWIIVIFRKLAHITRRMGNVLLYRTHRKLPAYTQSPGLALITRLPITRKYPEEHVIVCSDHAELRQLAPPGAWNRL